MLSCGPPEHRVQQGQKVPVPSGQLQEDQPPPQGCSCPKPGVCLVLSGAQLWRPLVLSTKRSEGLGIGRSEIRGGDGIRGRGVKTRPRHTGGPRGWGGGRELEGNGRK